MVGFFVWAMLAHALRIVGAAALTVWYLDCRMHSDHGRSADRRARIERDVRAAADRRTAARVSQVKPA